MSYTTRIYKIINNTNDECYIGSTTSTLNNRFSNHKSRYRTNKDRNASSCILFTKHGVDNCSIVLLEEIEVETKQQQYAIERKYIDQNKDCCVNIRPPISTDEELKKKAYQRGMKWYETNKEKQSKSMKLRYEQNKEEYKQKHNEWYEKNKEEFNRKRREQRKQLSNQE